MYFTIYSIPLAAQNSNFVFWMSFDEILLPFAFQAAASAVAAEEIAGIVATVAANETRAIGTNGNRACRDAAVDPTNIFAATRLHGKRDVFCTPTTIRPGAAHKGQHTESSSQ